MGAHRRKGKTLEQRIAFAIERDRKAAEERDRREREWWESLSEEEKQAIIDERRQRSKERHELNQALCFLGGSLLKSVLPYRI